MHCSSLPVNEHLQNISLFQVKQLSDDTFTRLIQERKIIEPDNLQNLTKVGQSLHMLNVDPLCGHVIITVILICASPIACNVQ